MENMVKPLLQVGDLIGKPINQPFGDLSQEDTAFAARVKKPRFAGTEQLLWQQVKHSIGQLGRSENFIA